LDLEVDGYQISEVGVDVKFWLLHGRELGFLTVKDLTSNWFARLHSEWVCRRMMGRGRTSLWTSSPSHKLVPKKIFKKIFLRGKPSTINFISTQIYIYFLCAI
jgi:hypothetical protein